MTISLLNWRVMMAKDKNRQQLVESVARKLNNNYPKDDIIDELIQEGFEKEQAKEFLAKIEHDLPAMNTARKRTKLKTSLKQIAIGCVLITIGVVATILSFQTDVAFVWYGIILVGLGLIGRALLP